jgi:hypothetical protein
LEWLMNVKEASEELSNEKFDECEVVWCWVKRLVIVELKDKVNGMKKGNKTEELSRKSKRMVRLKANGKLLKNGQWSWMDDWSKNSVEV